VSRLKFINAQLFALFWVADIPSSRLQDNTIYGVPAAPVRYSKTVTGTVAIPLCIPCVEAVEFVRFHTVSSTGHFTLPGYPSLRPFPFPSFLLVPIL